MPLFLWVIVILCAVLVIVRLFWLGEGIVPTYSDWQIATQVGVLVALLVWAVTLLAAGKG